MYSEKTVQSITSKRLAAVSPWESFAISGDRSPSSDFPTIELER
jgi:hypothetical protein